MFNLIVHIIQAVKLMTDRPNSSAPIPSDQQFWKDEPDYQPSPIKLTKFVGWIVAAYGVIMVLGVFGIAFGFVYQISHFWAWVILAYFVFIFGTSFLTGAVQRRRRRVTQQEVAALQQRAQEKAAAITMGSAIHVAGEPKLEREQNVVLALTPASLDIYDYALASPIDSVPLRTITAVHTVVFDDERVPHLDTIDSTAQALQMSIESGGVRFDCLFRTMRKVRPIDWYHAIQKARSAAGMN